MFISAVLQGNNQGINPYLLYLLDSTQVWLVNLAGRTLLYRPLKFKVCFVQNCFVVLLTFIASKSLILFKTFCYSKFCIKQLQNWPVLLSRCFRNLKPFRVKRNRFWARQTHSRDIINILLTSFFLVCTVSYGSLFFFP